MRRSNFANSRAAPPNYDDPAAAELGQRFSSPNATVLVSTATDGAPISIARLQSDASEHAPTSGAPRDAGYSVHVWMRSLDAELWIDGRQHPFEPIPEGRICLFDLTQNPVGLMHTPYEMVRFHFAGDAFEHFSAQNDEAPLRALRTSYGTPDSVLHSLSLALQPALSRAWEVNSLFVDHVALAVHSHLLTAYGPGVRRPRPRSGLSSWQERRAKELIETRLNGSLSLLELATECRLSPSHFSRAFLRTTGQSPHQWLIARRIERAKEFLAHQDLSLADVAKQCGFTDASHLIRSFSARCGVSPGAWRSSKRK